MPKGERFHTAITLLFGLIGAIIGGIVGAQYLTTAFESSDFGGQMLLALFFPWYVQVMFVIVSAGIGMLVGLCPAIGWILMHQILQVRERLTETRRRSLEKLAATLANDLPSI